MDVQIGPQLVEEAPQELRSRLWLALIDNPLLCHTYDEGKVHYHQHCTPAASCACGCRHPGVAWPPCCMAWPTYAPIPAAKLTVLVLHVQVEPASRSPLAASCQASRSNSSSRSHEGFVSVSSASRSSGSQHGTNSLLATAEAASESSGVQPSANPTSDKDGALAQEAVGTQLSQTSTLDTSRDQPVAVDPFEQSLHALHAEQQDSHSRTLDTASQKPASQQGGLEPQETAGVQEDSQQPSAVPEPQRSKSAPQVPVQDGKAREVSGAGSSAASARAASTEAAVNASPVGSASTDAWEMVQDANNIYNWKAGSLFGRSLSSNRRQGSECSQEGESYSQCERSCR